MLYHARHYLLESNFGWQLVRECEWGPFAFSDELPPEVAFEQVVPSVIEHLGLAADDRAPEAVTGSEPSDLPLTPSELVSDAGTAFARAERLQLMAVTY